jgi:hypothetical protein
MGKGFGNGGEARVRAEVCRVEELARQTRISAIKVGKLSRFSEDFLKTWVRKVIF